MFRIDLSAIGYFIRWTVGAETCWFGPYNGVEAAALQAAGLDKCEIDGLFAP